MTLYLAVETATELASVAVGSPTRVASEIRFGDQRHGAALIAAIGEALRISETDYQDLTGIVVSDGPGSFTGLRVGLATVKGILTAHEELELWTAPSLLGSAWNVHHFVSGPVAALYDALRGEVFGAVYAWQDGGVRTVIPPGLYTVADLEERCPTPPAVAVGDGAVAYADAVSRWTGRAPVGPPGGAPSGVALLELLGVEGGAVRVQDPARFEPAYGRLAEAQVRWEREHGGPLPDTSRDPEPG